ncbi:MAG TPA: phage tail protein [Baekduia sp.]|nr:phage tail protein [Baekduia sp.]
MSSLATSVSDGSAPATASHRALLRQGLPAVYHEGRFGMDFVRSLEEVLDPIIALLDCLPSHLNPDLAPEDLLQLLASWVGLEVDDVSDTDGRRQMLWLARDLARLRGTRQGLELLLELTLPGHRFDIHEDGGVTWSSEDGRPPAGSAAFEVVCRSPLTPAERGVLERTVRRAKPAHVAHRIVVASEQGGTT